MATLEQDKELVRLTVGAFMDYIPDFYREPLTERLTNLIRDVRTAERFECADIARDYWHTGKNMYARQSGRAVESRIRERK